MNAGPAGSVVFVGAGPGDPRLLTVRGAELLRIAGAVVCDGRVRPPLLDQRSDDASVVTADRPPTDGRSARETSAILADLARKHAVVVYLVDGTPLHTGDQLEIAASLLERGIGLEVVPGVSPETAAPVYAGMPLAADARDTVIVLAASDRPDPGPDVRPPEWARLAREAVIAVSGTDAGVERIAEALLRAGREARTPVARVDAGTTLRQRTTIGTLETLPPAPPVGEGEPRPVVVIGDAVALRERFAWFERRPLFGRRIVVTRPRAQAGSFVAALEALGAEVVQIPTIRIRAVPDAEPLRRAARGVDRFDWVVFTSTNGVAHFWSALRHVGRDSRALAGVSVCAIGPATAAALDREGIRADLIPERYVAESVIDALVAQTELQGARILLPRAELARSVLPDALLARGADVVEVVAYHTVPDAVETAAFRELLAAGGVDLITFTSSSTVQNFVALLGSDVGSAEIAAIGPVTAATARELGLAVHLEAVEYTVPGLVAAILQHYEKNRA